MELERLFAKNFIRKAQTYFEISKFKPKMNIELQSAYYRIRTISTAKELLETIKLRQKIFFEERNVQIPWSFDYDEFDLLCDHLVIEEIKTGQIVATYRLLSSEKTRSFYSENEFNLDDFLKAPGVKLELGRCCVHPDYRNGVVLDLLWQGLASYSIAIGARYLFGCSSVMTSNLLEAAELHKYFQDNQDPLEYKVIPTPEFKAYLPAIDHVGSTTHRQIPSLLKSYIRAGAKVYGEPAYDRDFKCFDFLTILDLRNINEKYFTKYFAVG